MNGAGSRRAELTEAIARHRWFGPGCTGCDWLSGDTDKSLKDDHAAHVADVLAPLVARWLAEEARRAWDRGRADGHAERRPVNAAFGDTPIAPLSFSSVRPCPLGCGDEAGDVNTYTVTVEYDPTDSVLLGRWKASIEDSREKWVGSCYGCFTRKAAERSARRFIRRLPGRRAYTVVIGRVEKV